ncbi:MAG: LLM class flavin-dependent oxidoreductase [Candidatus Binatia bacterium]
MKFGVSIGVSPRESFARFVGLVQTAEAAGIDAVWVVDSHLIMKDSIVALTAAALATKHIELGIGVANPITRHPTLLAGTFASLQDLSGGRALLGIGAGDSAVFPLGLQPARLAEMEDVVRTVKALGAGETAAVNGQTVRLATAVNPPPPVFVAATHPKMLALAGRLADGVIVMGPADPAFAAEQIGTVRDAAAAAGRPSGAPFIDLWVTVSMQSDHARALEDVRSWASANARWLNRRQTLPPSLERHREELIAAARDYDFSHHLSVGADHARVVGDALTEALAVAGDASACADRLSALAQLRPDRMTLTLLSGGREARLRAFAEDLLPRLGAERRGAAAPAAQ